MAVVAALAVVVAVPALAIALGNHRPSHRAQVTEASPSADKADRTAASPRPSRGHVPAPATEPTPEATPEPTVEPTPEETVEPTPEATQEASSPATQPATDPAPPAAAQPSGPAAQIETAIVAATNAQRAANGRAPLSLSSCATEQVTSRVAQLVAENGFYHLPVRQIMTACRAGAGENLALGYSDGSGVVEGWMNSPGHRDNLMNPDYTSMGVSCQQQNGRWLCGAVYLY